MGHERGITDIVDDHTINRAESLDKLGAMLGVSSVGGQVDDERIAVGVCDIHAVDDRAGRRGGVNEGRDGLLRGRDLQVQGNGVTGAGLSHICVPSGGRRPVGGPGTSHHAVGSSRYSTKKLYRQCAVGRPREDRSMRQRVRPTRPAQNSRGRRIGPTAASITSRRI